MKLQVGTVQVDVHKVILFGTNKRAHNLDGYVVNSDDEPIGYNKKYTPRKQRRIIDVDQIKPTDKGYLPYLTRDDRAIYEAIVNYAIVYRGARFLDRARLKVLENKQ